MKKLLALALVVALAGTAVGFLVMSDSAVDNSVVDRDSPEFDVATFNSDSAVAYDAEKNIREIIQKVIDENKDRWLPQMGELARVVKSGDWAKAAEIAVPLYADIFEKLTEALSDSSDASACLA